MGTWFYEMHMEEVTVCGRQDVEDLFVSGVIASTTEPEVINTPLNGSVAFFKSKDIYVTSDYLKIMMNFEFSAYEDAITMLRDSMSGLKGTANRNAYEDMMTILHANVSEREGVKHLVPVGDSTGFSGKQVEEFARIFTQSRS